MSARQRGSLCKAVPRTTACTMFFKDSGAGVHLIHLSEVAKGSERKSLPANQDYLHFIGTQVFARGILYVIFCNTTNSLHV